MKGLKARDRCGTITARAVLDFADEPGGLIPFAETKAPTPRSALRVIFSTWPLHRLKRSQIRLPHRRNVLRDGRVTRNKLLPLRHNSQHIPVVDGRAALLIKSAEEQNWTRRPKSLSFTKTFKY